MCRYDHIGDALNHTFSPSDRSMVHEPQPMPRFDNPPVVETVMGVFFRPLAGFTIAERSIFWSQLPSEFPAVEEKPPVDEVQESFDENTINAAGIRWQIEEFPPVRLWAKSDDRRHTLQIQQNVLFVNWERNPDGTDRYWHYGQRCATSIRNWKSLRNIWRKSKSGNWLRQHLLSPISTTLKLNLRKITLAHFNHC